MPMVGENPPADSKTMGSRSSRSMVESRLTLMILRSSLGWVPSTASMRGCLRNGSWMVCRSASRETTPLRRALLAKETSRRMSWSFCLRGAAKTCARLRKAATTVVSGNWRSTAPRVPPKTIRAAVGCRIWPRLPPSMSNPAIMPATARKTPPILALSMNCSSRNQAGRRRLHPSVSEGRIVPRWCRPGVGLARNVQAGDGNNTLQVAQRGQAPGHARQQARPVGQHPLRYLCAILADDQLFSVDQREHGVRGGLGGLDQIAVKYDRGAVEPGKFDHRPENSFAGVIGRRRRKLKD